MFETLKRILARRKVMPSPQPEIRHIRLGNVTAGVNIYAPEELLKISTVWRCVTLLGGAVATLPVAVDREKPDGTTTRIANHPVGVLLNRKPNPEMTASSFMKVLMQHKLLYGNFYAEIEVNGFGQPVALWPMAPDRVEPWRDPDGRLFYRIGQSQGGVLELDPHQVLHVPGLSWDGIRGYSILEVAMQSMASAYTLDRFAGGFFDKGMMPGGVIEIPPEVELSAEGMVRLQNEFLTKHAGWQKAQGPLILDQGIKYSPTQMDPEKGQFLDTRKFSVFDICRWFGVPPYLAFASDEEPRANVETQSSEFLMYGLDPHVIDIAQEADRKLYTAYRPTLLTHFNTDEFQRGDLKTRAEYYKTMRHVGVFSVNDILRREGMDPIGPEGDVRVMQVQFQPIGPDGAPTMPAGGMPAPPPGEPGESGEAGDAGSGTNGYMNGHG